MEDKNEICNGWGHFCPFLCRKNENAKIESKKASKRVILDCSSSPLLCDLEIALWQNGVYNPAAKQKCENG